MAKWLHVKSAKIRPFIVDETYTSKMLLDDDFLNDGCCGVVQINAGEFRPNPHPELAPNCCAHEGDEIYIVLSGKAEIVLDGESIFPEPGDVVFIPAHVSHGVKNLSTEEPFRLFTVWKDGRRNDMYFIRKEKWGKVNCTID